MYKSKLKIINPSFEVIEIGKNELDILKTLEKDARVCYKSEDKITDTSCYNFIKNIVKNGHEAMIEHVTLILKVGVTLYHKILENVASTTHYLAFSHCNDRFLISGNIRAFRDLHRDFKIGDITNFLKPKFPILFDDLPELETLYSNFNIELIYDYSDFNQEERLKHISFSVHFICCRGFTHEMVRMRKKWSYAQESTRYVDPIKKGNEFIVIRPFKHINRTDEPYNNLGFFQKVKNIYRMVFKGDNYLIWIHGMKQHEKNYVRMRRNNETPQIARGTLPIDVKTEIICSNTLENWIHTLTLRTPNNAHPSMYQLQRQVLRILKHKFPEEFDKIPDYDMETKLICKKCHSEFTIKSFIDLANIKIHEQINENVYYSEIQNLLIQAIYQDNRCYQCSGFEKAYIYFLKK